MNDSPSFVSPARAGYTLGMVRPPEYAGRFYPDDPRDCAAALSACLPESGRPAADDAPLYGAIVPHAAWTFSGRLTGRVLAELARRSAPQAVVLLGAAHALRGRKAALYGSGAWRTPLGTVDIDAALAGRLRAASDRIADDIASHMHEHSLEVQVPFIQHLFPAVPIVPLLVPPVPEAIEVGTVIGEVLTAGPAAVIIGTTDLTHYGPLYGLVDHGVGPPGLQWARQVNDRRMIAAIESLEPARVLREAAEHRNACGPGAVAATLAACQRLGAESAVLVDHITSQDSLPAAYAGRSQDAVGYAGFVFA